VTSFQFDIGDRARTAGRLLGKVRSELLRALAEQKAETPFTQQELAQKLEMQRSLINKQLAGESNLTLRALADFAWAMDLEINFELKKQTQEVGQNETAKTSTVGHSPMRFINGGTKQPLAPMVIASDATKSD
jgi:ribosome-binding protein aMBF1 (putative translation factor)